MGFTGLSVCDRRFVAFATGEGFTKGFVVDGGVYPEKAAVGQAQPD